jgi:hypothetical protein
LTVDESGDGGAGHESGIASLHTVGLSRLTADAALSHQLSAVRASKSRDLAAIVFLIGAES